MKMYGLYFEASFLLHIIHACIAIWNLLHIFKHCLLGNATSVHCLIFSEAACSSYRVKLSLYFFVTMFLLVSVVTVST